VALLLGNGVGVPAAYTLTAIALLLFAVGYTTMSRHHISTGAFYAYITSGLRQHIGGAAAYLALLGYNAMQLGVWGLFGAAASTFVGQEVAGAVAAHLLKKRTPVLFASMGRHRE
jgi:amino acid transporter